MTLADDSICAVVNPVVLKSITSNLEEKWTPRAIQRLRELIAEQLTTSQIAAALTQEIGLTFTRNAVIGKARRMNLQLLAKSYHHPVVKNPKPKTRSVSVARVKAPPIVAPTPPSLEEVVANPKRLTILEIQRGECYWPTSLEGSTVFCGHSTGSKEKSWCPAHSKLGYSPPYVRQWRTTR